MAENCKTEIRKGTAYQSWDWDKPATSGTEFKNLKLNSGGPWNTGLQGGDSKWQQEVWDCKPKVENFAEFEIGNLGESDWIWIKILYSDSLSLSESLIFKQKTFLKEFIKISESLKLNLNLKFDGSLTLDESNWFYANLKQSDSISLTDALKYIIINQNLNEEFFKLGESLNLNLTTSLIGSVRFSDAWWVKVPTGYGTLGYGASKYGD